VNTGESSLVVKWSGCEAYHSPLSGAKVISKVKKEWRYIFTVSLGKALPLPFTVNGMAYNSELSY
jgi:hypothetical protein